MTETTDKGDRQMTTIADMILNIENHDGTVRHVNQDHVQKTTEFHFYIWKKDSGDGAERMVRTFTGTGADIGAAVRDCYVQFDEYVGEDFGVDLIRCIDKDQQIGLVSFSDGSRYGVTA